MNLAVVGGGYVGLVTGACLADFGHTVVCVDTEGDRLDAQADATVPLRPPRRATFLKRLR